ncbi:c-type cytochrome domain-containing protein [Aquimarina agarivorans]|uniref:c-type cytochrome domain-containing protein n=1 Tax=Aquimarina agarivorans TaxID=980584 RepID=UPI000248FC8B|nr:c-type cytochrome domain-containing protein [Aquimarina agarivorans]
MEESNIILFFGRFHPLLVHLPIGFLIFAGIIEVTERFNFTNGLKKVVPFSLLLGTLSAVAASVLGLMLATSGDYNHEALDDHKWAGIATTLIALFAYLLSLDLSIFKAIKEKLYLVVVVVMIGGLSATGHLGGNLTHGEDYLTHYMPFKKKEVDPLKRPEVTEIAQAQFFGDVVHPIIKAKCYSCHNTSKQKGQLSFESIETYMKGGKHGKTIVAGDAAASELLIRVNLSEDDKLFMPPKGKTPLTEEEKLIIEYWINKGEASYDADFMASKPNEEMLDLVAGYLKLSGHSAGGDMVSFGNIPEQTIASLQEQGFSIRELAANSYAYDVVLPTGKSDASTIAQKLEALKAIKDNILWLSLENSGLTDAHVGQLNSFSNLRKLNISKNSSLTDYGLKKLVELKNMESISMYATKADVATIEALAAITKLKNIYVWKTNLDDKEIATMQDKHKQLTLVSGI